MAEIRLFFAAPLAAHLGRTVEEIAAEGLGAGDFSTREEVELLLPDGSQMRLRYAFFVVDGDLVGVFSEHNGYHLFAGPDLKVTCYRDGEVVSTLSL
jgi:hypothetical protein